MGRGLYENLREIPIPDWAKVNKATDMVYVVLNTRNKRGDFNRRLIGKRANKHTMYANDNFRIYYPEEWNKYYEGKLESKSDFLHFGLYAAVLGILHNSKGIFGIKDKVKLFSNNKEEGYAYLLFDGSNGTERVRICSCCSDEKVCSRITRTLCHNIK